MNKCNKFLIVLLTFSVSLNVSGQTKSSRGVTAVSVNDFLNSIGVNTHICQGQSSAKMVEPLKYTGIRAVRDGGNMLRQIASFITLHQQTGVKYCLMDISFNNIIPTAKQLAAAGALLAVEGPNEPNNWPVTYQGEKGGGKGSWLALAKFQRDLYLAVKNDPSLKNYPVFGASEMGAETDNVGLQYLVIPKGANTLMPDGTIYGDFLNVHNYVTGHIKGMIDNQSFKASIHKNIPAIDGLYGNHGNTWLKHFAGYSEYDLATIPKVTTETGWRTDNTPTGDDIHSKVLLSVFLDQYKAGWKYSFIYEMLDDRDGAFGFYTKDYVPRKAAEYLHNFTTILADSKSKAKTGKLNYSIPNQPETTHEMLMQKSNGKFELAVWSERVSGSDKITVNLGKRYRNVNIYDPTIGTMPTQTFHKVDSVTLMMSDHPMIIEIH